MNEKLIEMALDACVLTYVDHETPRHYYISPAADLNDLNDFAELIIRECVSAIESRAVEKPLSHYYIEQIQKHFGVEHE